MTIQISVTLKLELLFRYFYKLNFKVLLISVGLLGFKIYLVFLNNNQHNTRECK